MKNVEEILDEELNKLKISKTEREILIEEFEWRWEMFLDEEGPKPSTEKIRKFIKEFLKENAKEEKPKRQSQKESEQIDCIIRALKYDKQNGQAVLNQDFRKKHSREQALFHPDSRKAFSHYYLHLFLQINDCPSASLS